MSEGRERWMSQIKMKEREFTFPPPFCAIQVLKEMDDAPHHWQRQIFFTDSASSYANLFMEQSQRHTWK